MAQPARPSEILASLLKPENIKFPENQKIMFQILFKFDNIICAGNYFPQYLFGREVLYGFK